MRELRFRGKAESNRKWVYGNTIICDYDIHQVYIRDRHCGYDTTQWEEIVNRTLGQFTGLHDKNGREIYEGDIVVMPRQPEKRRKSVLVRHIVTCDSVCNWYFKSLTKEVLDLVMNHTDFDSYRFEVIGNIHDNPELTKVESLNLPEPKQRKTRRSGGLQVEIVVKDNPKQEPYIEQNVNRGAKIVYEVTQKEMNESVEALIKH